MFMIVTIHAIVSGIPTHGELDVSHAVVDAAIGLLAIATSLYIVYLLEIVKLMNPRIRRREAEARAQERVSA